ncbi:MAG: hypothetical protein PHV07_09460 [Oscillospiraceae bacterium]|nr:hypothetical protein [Oscillospiraceae bacterium]
MDWIDVILMVISFAFLLTVTIGLLHRAFRDYVGKEKAAEAKLIDKYSTRSFRQGKYQSGYVTTNILVFYVKGRTHKFEVDFLAYDFLEKGQLGILKYKGSRYIDFN